MEGKRVDLHTVVVAIVGSVFLASFLGFAWISNFRPEWLEMEAQNGNGYSLRQKAFLGLSALSAFAIVLLGSMALLNWMPSSLGSYNEDGDWRDLKLTLSSLIGFFGGVGVFAIILEYAKLKVRNEILSSQVSGIIDYINGTSWDRNKLKKSLGETSFALSGSLYFHLKENGKHTLMQIYEAIDEEEKREK